LSWGFFISTSNDIDIHQTGETMLKNKPLFFVIALLLAALALAACAPEPLAVVSTPVPETEAPTTVPTEVPLPEPTLAPSPTVPPTPAPIILKDGLGKFVTLETPAERVVSLAPSNTEILFAIGAGERVVGRDSFSDYPEAALAVTDIGGGWGELDLETILSLEPDLVLAADIIAPEQIQALEELGLVVFALPNPVALDGLYENLETVGKLTGFEEQAASLADELRIRVAAVDAAVHQAETRPLVFYQLDSTDPNAPWTSGPGTFIDTLITMAGGTNVGGILDGAWAQISVEELISQNPEVILIGDAVWGGVTAEDVSARPGWDVMAAVQNGSVFPFDDNLVSRPGPRLVDGLEELARLIHPEVFE
jgi:iron complex transport system substrate-binding protein